MFINNGMSQSHSFRWVTFTHRNCKVLPHEIHQQKHEIIRSVFGKTSQNTSTISPSFKSRRHRWLLIIYQVSRLVGVCGMNPLLLSGLWGNSSPVSRNSTQITRHLLMSFTMSKYIVSTSSQLFWQFNNRMYTWIYYGGPYFENS